jgi:hypothetical protein
LVLMPEAAMNEYNTPVSWQDNIRMSRVVTVQPESISLTMKKGTDSTLWTRVSVRNPSHNAASGLRCHCVSHKLMLAQETAQ